MDAGFGSRSLARRLREAGLPTSGFDAVLITHGHGDHCIGANSIVDKLSVPMFCNGPTRLERQDLCLIERWECFLTGVRFRIGSFEIEPFSVSHDAADPVGFRIEAEGICGAVATDLGEITPRVASRLAGCDWIVLESNHDEEMLRLSTYPWDLKQRLISPRGHLSNRACAVFLERVFDGYARHVFLAHISRNNNDPEIAFDYAQKALKARSTTTLHDLWDPCQVHLTHQHKPSIVINL